MSINIERAAKRAHPVYVANNWRWYGQGVPSESDIAEKIRYLLSRAEVLGEGNEPGEHIGVSTGRLRVQRDHFEDIGPEYHVFLELGNYLDDYTGEDV